MTEQSLQRCKKHDSCFASAIAHAQRICADQNARLTPIRQRVLEIIWQNHKAHKAYDILEAIAQEGQYSAKPPTVYRALGFLLDMSLIHKVESLNAYVGCLNPDHNDDHCFLICDQCDRVFDIVSDTTQNTIHGVCSEHNFTPKHKNIEIIGQCADCC